MDSGIFVRHNGESKLLEEIPLKEVPKAVEGWDVGRTAQILVGVIQGRHKTLADKERGGARCVKE